MQIVRRARPPRRAAASLAVALGLATALASALPLVAAEPTIDFIVVRADTLIGLSNSVLVSPTAWREVARLNRLPDANRIRPGQRLTIPTRLLRSDAASSTLVSVVGDVRTGDAPAVAGSALAEGQSVQTGPASSAVIELADGSRLRLPPSSLAQVAASRRYGERVPAGATASAADAASANAGGGWFAGTLRVLRGSVEVFATKVLRAKPLEVVTPTAVVGVRGTQYRVGFDDAANGRTHAEVLDGAVRFDLPRGAAGAELPAGFGAAADAQATPPAATRLSAAPDLATLPERFERLIVRFTVPGETAALRVQIASDPAFEKLVSDQRVAAGAEVHIADLDDARWHLRARRIDAQGIEGFDATHSFVLKARPQPPAYRAPRADAKQAVGSVEFAWAQNVDAPPAHLQVAEDAAFTRLVEDRDGVAAPSLRIEMPNPGTYYWRLASIRAGNDPGPYGDAQRFELRPLPTAPSVARSADGSALRFSWGGRAEDRQQVQLARDPAFADVVAQDELAASEWNLPLPSRGGRYYFRYRSVEPDGFVSPYSQTLMIDVPRDWSGLLLLLPALLLL